MVNLNNVNEELRKIDSRLIMESNVEDIDGQDYEEYGIDSIEDTRNIMMKLIDSPSSAIIIEKYFDFDNPKSLIILGKQCSENLKQEGLSIVDISNIEKTLMSFATRRLR